MTSNGTREKLPDGQPACCMDCGRWVYTVIRRADGARCLTCDDEYVAIHPTEAVAIKQNDVVDQGSALPEGE